MKHVSLLSGPYLQNCDMSGSIAGLELGLQLLTRTICPLIPKRAKHQNLRKIPKLFHFVENGKANGTVEKYYWRAVI